MASEPTIYKVEKRCPCGETWEGNSFSPPKPEPVVALCEKCLDRDAWEIEQAAQRHRANTPRAADVGELAPPQRAGEAEGVYDILKRLPHADD